MTDETKKDTGDELTDVFTSEQFIINAPPKEPPMPKRIGKYRIVRRIEAGGMGVVYEAEQTEPMRRRVAIKLIKAGMDSKKVIARFNTERQALALMNHECIARVYDAGETESGSPYFVMEYIQGESITKYCDKNRLSMDERLELFIRICEGVQHAHQKGIIHRDLKPSNILVTIQDDRALPKIIDFGIAKATLQHWAEHSVFTEYGQIVGTPEYMSPEQAEMTELDIDTRTDIYSLGVVLYEILVGAVPIDQRELRKAGLNEMIRVIREEEPSRPSTRITTLDATDSGEVAQNRRVDIAALVRELRGDLDWITLKALEKDRLRRYVSAAELAEDIRRHMRDEPVIAGPPDLSYRAQKFVRRHRAGVIFGSVLALALVLGAAGTTVGMVRARAAEKDARYEAKTSREITEFLLELFGEADPGQARGEERTVREVLDEGSGQIRNRLGGQPRLRARIMEAIGLIYRNLGLYPEARDLLEDSVRLRVEQLGELHPEVAEGKNSLGGTLIKMKQYDEARPLIDEALAIQRRTLDGRDAEIGRTLNNLGGLAHKSGQRDEARTLWEQSLEIREAALGERHPAVIKMIGNLGVIYGDGGDLDRGQRFLRRAVRLAREELGNDHFQVAKLLQNLAVQENAAGDFAAGKKNAKESLAIRVKVQGDRHPDLAKTLESLGDSHVGLGEDEDALARLGQSLSIQIENGGPATRDALRVRQTLITQMRKMHHPDLEETLAAQQGAIDSMEDDDQLIEPLRKLAATLRELGREKAAAAAESRADGIAGN